MRRAWLLYLGRELEKKRNEVQASVGRCKDLLITTVPWLVLRGSPELHDGCGWCVLDGRVPECD